VTRLSLLRPRCRPFEHGLLFAGAGNAALDEPPTQPSSIEM